MEPLHRPYASVAEERGESHWLVAKRRCTAEYDPFGNKRCTLLEGHGGKHHAQWEANMLFDHDYRDLAASEWLDD